jgi:hypothetical protein
MASLFARGKSVKYIVDVIAEALYILKLLMMCIVLNLTESTLKQQGIHRNPCSIYPWMSKYHFLEPHPVYQCNDQCD